MVSIFERPIFAPTGIHLHMVSLRHGATDQVRAAIKLPALPSQPLDEKGVARFIAQVRACAISASTFLGEAEAGYVSPEYISPIARVSVVVSGDNGELVAAIGNGTTYGPYGEK